MGREATLHAIAAMVEDPQSGGVLLNGPAGVGKTRLADELLVRLRAAGHRTARTVATPGSQTIPFAAIGHLVPDELMAEASLAGAVKVFGALRELLDGHDKRLVMMIDDMPFIDEASLTVGMQLHAAGLVFMIGTARTGMPLTPSADGLMRSFAIRRVDIHELDVDEVATVASEALGAPIDPLSAAQLWDATRGNALYLRELLLSVEDSGITQLPSGALRLDVDPSQSPRLVELVSDRLRGLEPALADTLALIAVAEPLLVGDIERAGLLDHTIALEQYGVVTVDDSGTEPTVRLAHPLHGEVLRSTMVVLRRRRQIQRAIDIIGGRPNPRPDDALRLALWRLDIGQVGEPDVLMSGARLARSALDLPSTIRLARAAHDVRRSAASQHLLTEALFLSGSFDEAEMIAAEPEPDDATPASHLLLVAPRVNNLLWGVNDTARALAVVEAERPFFAQIGTSHILDVVEANVHAYDGRPLRVLDKIPMDQPGGLLRILTATPLSTALILNGRLEDGVAVSMAAHATQMAQDDPKAFLDPNTHIATGANGMLGLGRFAEVDGMVIQAHADSMSERVPFMRSFHASVLGRSALRTGRLLDAQLWFADARAAAEEIGFRPSRRIAMSGLASALGQQGKRTESAAILAELEALEPDINYMLSDIAIGSAWALAALGRIGEARSVLREAAEGAMQRDEWWPALEVVIECARLGDADTIRDLVDEIEPHVQGPLTPVVARFARAMSGRSLQMLADVGADLAKVGMRLLAAEAAVELARLQRRDGMSRDAASTSARAMELIAQCQGANTPGIGSVESSTSLLTNREREIAVLAAEGLTSKEIADRLFLSVRTVDNHLQNVYLKLGVKGRAELSQVI